MSSKKSIHDARIAISGKSGCGNTTVSRLISNILDLRFINYTFRNLAQEKGLSFEQILDLAKEDDSLDKEVDKHQVELARKDGGCVLGSRLAIWMLPEADLKVYLSAKLDVRVKRIQNREGGTLDDIIKSTKKRDKQDRERYLKIYNIDNDNYSFADIVIQTDETKPAEIAEMIISELKKKIAAT